MGNPKKHSSTFPPIELLIVIAIFAIPAAMLLPALNKARHRAKNAACFSNLQQASLMFSSYARDSFDIPGHVQEDTPLYFLHESVSAGKMHKYIFFPLIRSSRQSIPRNMDDQMMLHHHAGISTPATPRFLL